MEDLISNVLKDATKKIVELALLNLIKQWKITLANQLNEHSDVELDDDDHPSESEDNGNNDNDDGNNDNDDGSNDNDNDDGNNDNDDSNNDDEN